MEAEISSELGATHGERSAERSGHRNGYRERLWETRVGAVELSVPRKRSGASYFPSFLEPRRPCEQAIVAVVMEAYVVRLRDIDTDAIAGFQGDLIRDDVGPHAPRPSRYSPTPVCDLGSCES